MECEGMFLIDMFFCHGKYGGEDQPWDGMEIQISIAGTEVVGH